MCSCEIKLWHVIHHWAAVALKIYVVQLITCLIAYKFWDYHVRQYVHSVTPRNDEFPVSMISRQNMTRCQKYRAFYCLSSFTFFGIVRQSPEWSVQGKWCTASHVLLGQFLPARLYSQCNLKPSRALQNGSALETSLTSRGAGAEAKHRRGWDVTRELIKRRPDWVIHARLLVRKCVLKCV